MICYTCDFLHFCALIVVFVILIFAAGFCHFILICDSLILRLPAFRDIGVPFLPVFSKLEHLINKTAYIMYFKGR